MLFNPALEAGWSSPVTVSTTLSDQPQVSVDTAGNAVAIWQGFDGSNFVIQSARRPLLGSWSTPITISMAGGDAQGPEIAHDKLGNVVAVWSRYNGANSIIQATQLPVGGTWMAPVNISADGGNADSCALATDKFGVVGNSVTVWHRFNGSNFIIQAATLPLGGSWSSAINISADGQDALVPQVDVDSKGNSVITFNSYNGTNFNILSSSNPFSQSWSPSQALNIPGQTNIQPATKVDPNLGTGYVLWSEFDGSNYIIQSSSLPLGGTAWSSPLSASISGENAFIPDLSIDTTSELYSIWVRFNGSNYILQGSTLLPLGLGTWSSPINISQSGMDVGNIDICVDSVGNATAIWDISDGINSIIQSSHRSKLGNWSTPVTISNAGQYAYLPSLDVDASGNVTAVWLESSGSMYVVKSAKFTVL